MAVRILFSRRWYGGMISTTLEVFLEMWVKIVAGQVAQ